MMIGNILKEYYESTKKMLVHVSVVKSSDTLPDIIFSVLQDLGFLLFNRNTKMVCLNPQLLAKALACFVMPPEHEKIAYSVIPTTIRRMSIIPMVFDV